MDQAAAFRVHRRGNSKAMTENLPSKIDVVGLGYVGLPLAAAFSKVLPTIGFDINQDRVAELLRKL